MPACTWVVMTCAATLRGCSLHAEARHALKAWVGQDQGSVSCATLAFRQPFPKER